MDGFPGDRHQVHLGNTTTDDGSVEGVDSLVEQPETSRGDDDVGIVLTQDVREKYSDAPSSAGTTGSPVAPGGQTNGGLLMDISAGVGGQPR